jgi:hypothetical protein
MNKGVEVGLRGVCVCVCVCIRAFVNEGRMEWNFKKASLAGGDRG